MKNYVNHILSNSLQKCDVALHGVANACQVCLLMGDATITGTVTKLTVIETFLVTLYFTMIHSLHNCGKGTGVSLFLVWHLHFREVTIIPNSIISSSSTLISATIALAIESWCQAHLAKPETIIPISGDSPMWSNYFPLYLSLTSNKSTKIPCNY